MPPVPALTEWGGWPVLPRLRRAGGEEREAAPRLSPPPTQIRLSAQGWRVEGGVDVLQVEEEMVEEGFIWVPDRALKGLSPSQIIDISN